MDTKIEKKPKKDDEPSYEPYIHSIELVELDRLDPFLVAQSHRIPKKSPKYEPQRPVLRPIFRNCWISFWFAEFRQTNLYSKDSPLRGGS